jgi:hypothetical protein
MGERAREEVRELFLGPRHLRSDDLSRIPGDIPDGLYTVEPDGSRLR